MGSMKFVPMQLLVLGVLAPVVSPSALRSVPLAPL